MKIVFIINSSRYIGGGDYAQFVFANTLAKKGHEIIIFSGDKNFYSSELKNVHAFYRHTIPIFIKKAGIGILNKLWTKIYSKARIEPYIKKHKPDIIVGYLRDSAIQAQQLAEKYNCKVANFVFENPLWMEEDLKEVWYKQWQDRTFKNSWARTKIAYEKSDILIPNSKLSAKKMKEWIPKANISKQVYPGVSIPNKKHVKRTIDVIYIGRLNELKHVDVLLRALNPSWRTIVVGRGEEEEKLKVLANELGLNVQFKGSISDAKKWSLLFQSKVLATATSHEGFGMPPLEALACGCNVVCSDLEIFHEVYGNEVSYFKLHDSQGMNKKIAFALRKPPASTTLHKKYTWETAANTIENILEEVCR